MRVLFAIFMVAFAGLVWASVAAARHVRRARIRRRAGRQVDAHAGAVMMRPSPPPPLPAGDLGLDLDQEEIDPLSEVASAMLTSRRNRATPAVASFPPAPTVSSPPAAPSLVSPSENLLPLGRGAFDGSQVRLDTPSTPPTRQPGGPADNRLNDGMPSDPRTPQSLRPIRTNSLQAHG